MLLGGFQHIDLELLQHEAKKEEFKLRFDSDNLFKRRKYTNTGRTASIYLFNQCGYFKENDVILLPDYLCLSIIAAFAPTKLKYRFYRIDKDLNIDTEDLKRQLDNDVRAIYITDFFGFPFKKETVDELKKIREEKNIALIEDITQTLFSRSKYCMGFADYILCSTRKWMPMTDGGLLAARDGACFDDIELENGYNEAAYKQLLVSLMRDYCNDNPYKDMSLYLELEREANRVRYTDLTVRNMTSEAKQIMMNCDTAELIKKRIKNYSYLYANLKDMSNMKIIGKELDANEDIVPFGFLILTEKRDEFYKYLINHGIIGEIQWILPKDYYAPGKDSEYLSDHNLMIHCDQRYGIMEMEYIIKTIKTFFHK